MHRRSNDLRHAWMNGRSKDRACSCRRAADVAQDFSPAYCGAGLQSCLNQSRRSQRKACHMRTLLVGVLLLLGAPVLGQEHLDDFTSPRVYEGPPLSVSAALREAQDHNPELLALRRQFESTRFRSEEQRFLSPPMLEDRKSV